MLFVALLAACEAPDPDCAALMAEGDPPRAAADIEADLVAVQQWLFPELAGVSVSLGELESETDFFVSNLELSTFENPPLQRSYLVLHNPLLFDEPPPHDAVVAILAHELKHVVDYTGMDSEELAAFALWYASEDTAAYERETDEAALERGCATGLKSYREWLYPRLSEEDAAEKRRVYYTPEEIDAWVEANE